MSGQLAQAGFVRTTMGMHDCGPAGFSYRSVSIAGANRPGPGACNPRGHGGFARPPESTSETNTPAGGIGDVDDIGGVARASARAGGPETEGSDQTRSRRDGQQPAARGA